MSGAFTQREMRRRDSRDVGFAPESDRLLHRREMTRRAKSDRVQLQQIFEAKSRNRMMGVDKGTFSN